MIETLRPKKIGVDGSALVKVNPTGVEKATTEMLWALLNIDNDNKYYIYVPRGLPENFKKLSNIIERIISNRRFWTQTALPRAIGDDNLDIFWSPSNILPPKLPPKSLATIYDVAFVVHPEIYSWWNRILQRATVMRAKSMATKIIAITESTKEDIKRYFDISDSKISVVPMAKPTHHSVVQPKLPKWQNYILVVGRVESKKNSLNIVKTFEKLLSKNLDLHLVFAGPDGFGFEKVKQYAKSINNIHFLGFVSDEELNGLYNHAKLLFFPSLYEGFGMTILEGFAAGIPVVTSNFGAMKEVAQEAAVLVNPHDIDNMVLGVNKLLVDKSVRQKYIIAGYERLKDFSWDKSAIKIKDIINNL